MLKLMDSAMQLPPIDPLEAPHVWDEWVSRLDPATWVLITNALIASLDPFALTHSDLILVNALIDRRDAMLLELPTSTVIGERH